MQQSGLLHFGNGGFRSIMDFESQWNEKNQSLSHMKSIENESPPKSYNLIEFKEL